MPKTPEAAALTKADGFSSYVDEGWPLLAQLSGRTAAPIERVRVGRAEVPKSFTLHVSADPTPNPYWSVELLFIVNEEGSIELVNVYGLGVEADAGLDQIRKARPLSWWKKRAVVQWTLDDTEMSRPDLDDMSVWSRLVAASEVSTVRRRDRITDAKLAEVADVYRRAWESGKNPTEAVARHFYKSHSTAGRWVGLARKANKLGPAVGPTGGEQL